MSRGLLPAHLVVFCFAMAFAEPRENLGAEEPDPYAKARQKMVEERVEREGVRNEVVIKAMLEVPRHLFVAPKYYADAYREVIIDIGHKQTLSTAYIVGYMTEAVDPQPGDRVLEIGTGSGYQAAVLSKIVKEVYTIEIVEDLAHQATERLKRLKFQNVHTLYGDGYKGWPQHAPFDKIIVTCSPEKVPQPLLEQLAEGGKMIIPLGERYRQVFYLYEKKHGRILKTRLLPTLFVPMTGQAENERRVHTNSAIPRVYNGGFEVEKEGLPDGWFYFRQATLEHKGAPQGKSFLLFSNREFGRDAHALQAFGVDGRRVRSLGITVLAQAEDIVPGPETYEKPALAMRFFDSQNRMVGEDGIGGISWLGTFRWSRFGKEIPVPREAQMAMIQIGLRGAIGRLSVDDIRMTSQPR
jgi:protein-L-isoaspartate(D-aspartate) O-methyltransferase